MKEKGEAASRERILIKNQNLLHSKNLYSTENGN